MAIKKKNNKEAEKFITPAIEEFETEEISKVEVEAVEEVEAIEKAEIVEDIEVIKEETPKKGEKICPVMLATPSYYIINKDGVNITIKGKNDKRRGDSVVY